MLEKLLRQERKQVLLSPNLRKQQTEPSLSESETDLNFKTNKPILSVTHSRNQSRSKSRYAEGDADNEEKEQVDANSLLSFHREVPESLDKNKCFQTVKDSVSVKERKSRNAKPDIKLYSSNTEGQRKLGNQKHMSTALHLLLKTESSLDTLSKASPHFQESHQPPIAG